MYSTFQQDVGAWQSVEAGAAHKQAAPGEGLPARGPAGGGSGKFVAPIPRLKIIGRVAVVQAIDVVTLCFQIIRHFHGGPEDRHTVIDNVVGFGYTPEFASLVIFFRGQNLPAVLINVVNAAIIDVADAGASLRLDYPHPVKLVSGQVLIDVVRPDHVIWPNTFIVQFIGVIGDDQFTLALEFPVVLIRGTVVHVLLVD